MDAQEWQASSGYRWEPEWEIDSVEKEGSDRDEKKKQAEADKARRDSHEEALRKLEQRIADISDAVKEMVAAAKEMVSAAEDNLAQMQRALLALEALPKKLEQAVMKPRKISLKRNSVGQIEEVTSNAED